MLRDIAPGRKRSENRRHRITRTVNMRAQTFRQHARNIIVKSAAGNMHHAFDIDRVQKRQNRFRIQARRREQFLTERTFQTRIDLVQLELFT